MGEVVMTTALGLNARIEDSLESAWTLIDVQVRDDDDEPDVAIIQLVSQLTGTVNAQAQIIDHLSKRVDKLRSHTRGNILAVENDVREELENVREEQQNSTQDLQCRVQQIEHAVGGNTGNSDSPLGLVLLLPICYVANKVCSAIRYFI